MFKDSSNNHGDLFPTRDQHSGIVIAAPAFGAGQSAVIEPGRALVPDFANARAASAADRAAPNSPTGDLANFIFPAAAGDVRRPILVVQNQPSAAGQPFTGAAQGVCRVLTSDTTANMAVGVFATVSFANDNSRGTFRLAASGEAIVGQVLVAPATNGTAAVPQPCTIHLFGAGAYNRPAP